MCCLPLYWLKKLNENYSFCKQTLKNCNWITCRFKRCARDNSSLNEEVSSPKLLVVFMSEYPSFSARKLIVFSLYNSSVFSANSASKVFLNDFSASRSLSLNYNLHCLSKVLKIHLSKFLLVPISAIFASCIIHQQWLLVVLYKGYDVVVLITCLQITSTIFTNNCKWFSLILYVHY